MSKDATTRFSVSLPQSLMRQLDAMVQRKGYTNRSLAVADMIRDHLVEYRQGASAQEIAGTITLVYDHHQPRVQETLTERQHLVGTMIVSALHVHLEHHNCLEVLVVRGKAAKVQALANQLTAIKGVKHGKLTVTTTGKDLPC